MKQLIRSLFLALSLCLVLSAGVAAENPGNKTTTLGDLSDDLQGSDLMKAAGTGDMNAVRVMIGNGANINEKLGLTSRTALMKAAQNGHTNIVSFLIEKGADVNIEDSAGASALMYAAEAGYKDTVRALLEKGAHVNKGKGSTTALMYAAKNGHTDIVRLLIEKGADVNAVAAGSGTALMDAAGNGHADIVRILLERGANVNVNVGGTALMFAAREGNADIVRALLKKGADLNAEDSVGYTALSLAEARGHADIVRILKEVAGERGALQKKSSQENAQDSLSTADMEVLNQLQPPATIDEKKLYQQAKSKNEISKFIATRKYIRLLKAQFGNKKLDEEDLKKAPSAADPNINFEYAINFEEQLTLFNITLYQGIEKK